MAHYVVIALLGAAIAYAAIRMRQIWAWRIDYPDLARYGLAWCGFSIATMSGLAGLVWSAAP